MRVPNANPIYDLVYKNEVSGKHLIDLPAPLKGSPEDKMTFCRIFAKKVGEAYKVRGIFSENEQIK